jgi:protein-disulfide isomerase
MLNKLTITAILTLLALPVSTTVYSASEGQILGGSLSAPVTIEVFSDFQCPSCRDFYLGTIRQVLQNYSRNNKVCVIYHDLQITNNHKYSLVAARYAEAASRMGRQNLLRVYDAIYADQVKWSQNGNVEATLAKALSPQDFQTIKRIVNDPSINQAVRREMNFAQKQNITSTPTIILHYSGKQEKVANAITYNLMKQAIDSKLK